MPDFSVDSPTPVYVRVADWIESRIKSGELKPGARLPPERELAPVMVRIGRVRDRQQQFSSRRDGKMGPGL